MITFANLPKKINGAVSEILSKTENSTWLNRAEKLHLSYTQGVIDSKPYVTDYFDVLAYLGLRVPATYAQITGALLQIQQDLPKWSPKSVLDLGSGPATAVWAASTIWPNLESATCIDQNKYFISVGKEIMSTANLPIDITWHQQNLTTQLIQSDKFDLVIIANVLNELSTIDAGNLLNQAYSICSGVIIILEPGTPNGFKIIQKMTKKLLHRGKIIAPYMENTFIPSDDFWLHFPQRFIRPEFLRRIRQRMRDSSLMASDWEEVKYSYIAISKISLMTKAWGRVVGPTQKRLGVLKIPILTKNGIAHLEVWKRFKKEYSFVKKLRWGELILNSQVLSKSIAKQVAAER